MFGYCYTGIDLLILYIPTCILDLVSLCFTFNTGCFLFCLGVPADPGRPHPGVPHPAGPGLFPHRGDGGEGLRRAASPPHLGQVGLSPSALRLSALWKKGGGEKIKKNSLSLPTPFQTKILPAPDTDADELLDKKYKFNIKSYRYSVQWSMYIVQVFWLAGFVN